MSECGMRAYYKTTSGPLEMVTIPVIYGVPYSLTGSHLEFIKDSKTQLKGWLDEWAYEWRSQSGDVYYIPVAGKI